MVVEGQRAAHAGQDQAGEQAAAQEPAGDGAVPVAVDVPVLSSGCRVRAEPERAHERHLEPVGPGRLQRAQELLEQPLRVHVPESDRTAVDIGERSEEVAPRADRAAHEGQTGVPGGPPDTSGVGVTEQEEPGCGGCSSRARRRHTIGPLRR